MIGSTHSGRLAQLPVLLTTLVALAMAGSACQPTSAEQARLLAQKRSPYSVVSVEERGTTRYLKLGDLIQSAWDPKRPRRMPYPYSKLMATAVAGWPGSAQDQPASFLMIGLGGGTLTRHLSERYPRLAMTVVELDPVVVEFAKKYFGVSPKIEVHVADGRAFLEKNLRRFDIIALDAFSENYIPPALMTREFLVLVASRLKPGGLLLVNTWSTSRWRDYETRTYQEVFPVLLELTHPDAPNSNRILIAGPAATSSAGLRMHALATHKKKNIDEFSVPHILTGLTHLTQRPKADVLTDANVHRIVKQ